VGDKRGERKKQACWKGSQKTPEGPSLKEKVVTIPQRYKLKACRQANLKKEWRRRPECLKSIPENWAASPSCPDGRGRGFGTANKKRGGKKKGKGSTKTTHGHDLQKTSKKQLQTESEGKGQHQPRTEEGGPQDGSNSLKKNYYVRVDREAKKVAGVRKIRIHKGLRSTSSGQGRIIPNYAAAKADRMPQFLGKKSGQEPGDTILIKVEKGRQRRGEGGKGGGGGKTESGIS